MKYLHLFEKKEQPLYKFILGEMKEYFNYNTDAIKDFIEKTMIGKRFNASCWRKELKPDKVVGYRLEDNMFATDGYNNSPLFDHLKGWVPCYPKDSETIMIYDEIPEKSKFIIQDIKKKKIQKRFDL